MTIDGQSDVAVAMPEALLPYAGGIARIGRGDA